MPGQTQSDSLHFDLTPADNSRLANICGQFNEHLKQLEDYFHVSINCRSNHFHVTGADDDVHKAMQVIQHLYELTQHEILTPSDVQLSLTESGFSESVTEQDDKKHSPAQNEEVAPMENVTRIGNSRWSVKTRKGLIRGRGDNQTQYLKQIQTNDLCLGIGPAGTGKTYLAVACAVNALENDEVERVLLVRPAVEAGERLGFLPGDLAQKIDPYLRPMYDALYEMLGVSRVEKLLERNIIEIAPLAYMRGRTLNDAFIILDEAQNTTIDQMKMFLTRIGFGSKAVVTGDITQVDLPHDKLSGLRHAMVLLEKIEGVGITRFSANDVVRHPLVKKIVKAYEKDEKNQRAR